MNFVEWLILVKFKSSVISVWCQLHLQLLIIICVLTGLIILQKKKKKKKLVLSEITFVRKLFNVCQMCAAVLVEVFRKKWQLLFVIGHTSSLI